VVEALATAFQDLDRWEEHTDTLTKPLENYLSVEHRDAPGIFRAGKFLVSRPIGDKRRGC
jgi:hypothetical protein